MVWWKKTESPSLTAARGHTDNPYVTGMLILLIHFHFFMAVWEVKAIIGYGTGAHDVVTGTYNKCVCVSVCDRPLLRQPPFQL